jgi:hypothetical protein
LKLRSTILDGEIVALDEEGIPRFQLLQKWQKRPTAPVAYVLFDLLWDNGRDVTGKSVIRPCARNRSHVWSASANRKFSFGITLFLSIPRASKSSRSAFARDALEAFKAAVEAGEMTGFKAGMGRVRMAGRHPAPRLSILGLV